MKLLVSIVIFSLTCFEANAYDPYRQYLLSQVNATQHFTSQHIQKEFNYSSVNVAAIPRYERPKGSIFCRMEDKMIKSTGVWLTLGVK